MTEDTHLNGVRVTNGDIYNKLLQVERDVNGVSQRVDEVVLPAQTKMSERMDRVELRVYAILAGLAAAAITAIGAKGIGLI